MRLDLYCKIIIMNIYLNLCVYWFCVGMDRKWMFANMISNEYKRGVEKFVICKEYHEREYDSLPMCTMWKY